MKLRSLLAVLVICAATMLGAAAARASSLELEQGFVKDFASNALYFWSDDTAKATFAEVDFGGTMKDWKVALATPGALTLTGPGKNSNGKSGKPGDDGDKGVVKLDLVAPFTGPLAGRFDIAFKYQGKPFSIQWAEVLFDTAGGGVLRGFGTLAYNGKSGWSKNTSFTHLGDLPLAPAPVPLPPSALLMGSSLALFPLLARRRRGVRA